MDFAELSFKRIDGDSIKTQDYIDWANELLENGCDAPSIWDLAFLRWEDYVYSDQVERLFQSSIGELGLELPTDWYAALWAYSSRICENLPQGKISPWDCMHEMLTIADNYNEPYIHWIWVDLCDDLNQRAPASSSIEFNSALNLEDPDLSIRTVVQQFLVLCCMSLPDKFPCVWRCETCEAIGEESTFTETKTCVCPSCGGASTMKNMRFFEHRDALVRTLLSSRRDDVLR